MTPAGQRVLKRILKTGIGKVTSDIADFIKLLKAKGILSESEGELDLNKVDAREIRKNPSNIKVEYLSKFYDLFSHIFGVGAPLIDSFDDFSQYIWRYLYTLRMDGCRVVDVGCGSGYYSRKLSELGAKVVPVDISPERLKHSPILKKLPCVVASVEDMPFAANTFDMAICIFVLEHIINVEAAIGELLRIIKHGGKLLIAIPSMSLSYIISHIWRKYLDIAHFRIFGIFGWLAPWCMSTIKLVKIIKRKGGKIKSIEAVKILDGNSKLIDYINRVLSRKLIFRYLGAQTIIYAEKTDD